MLAFNHGGINAKLVAKDTMLTILAQLSLACARTHTLFIFCITPLSYSTKCRHTLHTM